MRSIFSRSSPIPLSVTVISKYSFRGSRRVASRPVESETVISPCSGVYLKALEKIFINILSKLFISTHTFNCGIACSKLKCIFFFRAI